MTEILKGAPVAAALNEKIQAAVKMLEANGVRPALAIVRVGEKPDDISYERTAKKRCAAAGVEARGVALPEDCGQERLIETLRGLNSDKTVHGVLLFRPLPKYMDDDAVRNSLAPGKDVDGITDASLAGVFAGSGRGYPPCTAQACMEILDFYGVELKGKRATVIGRSLVVGKPAAMMLLGRHATITVCHTRTADMPSACRNAEILVASAGRPEIIGGEYLSPGQTVIDVGINVLDDGSLRGDVNFAEAAEIAAAVTPVPGGVGAVTTSVLLAHVADAAAKYADFE
ncbi:MAG: bifunctional 5,10-methylenetetrahydrofolate dehydrogenase/5,10-methenyltetrahydrofolate cyclohydrolase [Synergistaceae bacterium]|jgi:methylenetetrahydrofolate dehydrogenase (NADP+)/methenyltetrahydrofolate cyclohydrolase|nr:bifunctional 5,10-methylenetetrahydrofolate dehydrogenase/5,10-methenyltetrahydrofolate cyclohydrolase [Synergistaceae bacterium]